MLIVFFFLIYMNKVEEGEGSYSHNATLANTSLKKKIYLWKWRQIGEVPGRSEKKNWVLQMKKEKWGCCFFLFFVH